MKLGARSVIELRHVSCSGMESGVATAVHDVSVELTAASVTVFTGPDGCGKNRLLRVLGLLDLPDDGTVLFRGSDVSTFDDEEREETRGKSFGYVLSPPFLLPELTVIENIAIPLFRLLEMSPALAHERTEMLVDFVGLRAVSTERIDRLSPGLQLRAGVARALGVMPALMIVEEPDRILRERELESFRRLLREAAARFGCAVAVSARADLEPFPGERRIECAGGRIVCDVVL